MMLDTDALTEQFEQMVWHRRLRWRLIAPQFIVVVVGVGVMVAATWLMLRSAPLLIRPALQTVAESGVWIDQSEAEILALFRNGILLSVTIAAVFALIAGVASAIVLWRIIIAPLQQVAVSSQRIANGRYRERVDIPTNSGRAMAKLVINFNQMAAALEKTEQERIALLSNVSHELRTPLTGLRGYVEGMMDNLFPANEETFSWMGHEIGRLQRLVDDIQNLSRIEAGQFSLNFADFELTAVIQPLLNQLRPQAQSKQISVAATFPDSPVVVHADADRTAQVLINLLGNAIRYTPEGGEIAVAVRVAGRQAEIAVADSGIGIPAEALPYLFERFYRVDASRARKSGGSGIGLTIARHLVWAMGGEMSVISAGVNQGSTFSFTLPLSQN